MSLDVYLHDAARRGEGIRSGIFIREDGQTREISREEWDRVNPGREPVTAVIEDNGDVYWNNITHNLGRMAGQAGLYDALWRPDEHGMQKAGQLIAPLETGLRQLKADPEKFRTFSPTNGWGSYEGLVAFTESYLDACRTYPDAEVRVSR